MSNPIADLSYRNYDGPLESPRLRWWVIARMMCRLSFKRKWFWIFTGLSAWYYFAMIIILIFVEQVLANAPRGGAQGFEAFVGRIQWKDQLLHGFSFAQLPMLMAAVLIGAGAIANDNRANALLVYLSKPCSKRDYLLGKWVGLFLPLCVLGALPSVVFYGYGFLSFAEYGFTRQDPWMLLKLLAAVPVAAAFHSSLVLGVSSLFNQGRWAGATYAGIYFLTLFFTQLMLIPWLRAWQSAEERGITLTEFEANPPPLIANLFYGSIDGLNIGAAKAFLGTNGSPIFGAPQQSPMFPAPPLPLVLGVMAVLSALALLVAWRRVRAVEVVQ